jgi:hypothetical protein
MVVHDEQSNWFTLTHFWSEITSIMCALPELWTPQRWASPSKVGEKAYPNAFVTEPLGKFTVGM